MVTEDHLNSPCWIWIECARHKKRVKGQRALHPHLVSPQTFRSLVPPHVSTIDFPVYKRRNVRNAKSEGLPKMPGSKDQSCVPTDECRARPCERCTRMELECRFESIQGNVSARQTVPDGKNTIQFDTPAPPRGESNVASTRPPGRSRRTEQRDVHNQPGSYADANPHGVYSAQHAAYNGRAGPSGPTADLTQRRWPAQGYTNPQAAQYPVYAEHVGQDHYTQIGYPAPHQYGPSGQGYHDGHVEYSTSASYWQPSQGQQQQHQRHNGGDGAYPYQQ
ncbi:unnamed protein product [Mycena citricolor]|uniref:Uncharacterized protein n=1 Tax=Mycena citricolor TaxID=2018698 RepID=A0AAD2HWV7_9AGAR|nr:unnamed protein product [Mycena citricolor]